MNDKRIKLLTVWAGGFARAAVEGALAQGKPLALRAIETINGPRAGALEIDAGTAAGALLQALTAQDYALHRQFVPWDFTGEPAVYMVSRYVRLEAGWPDDLAEKDIPLKTLGRHPVGAGRWIVGKNEAGATITLGLDDAKPHYLFGGFTGSGKTWALRAALAQLAADKDNRLVLCDGKYGDGLGCLQGLHGLDEGGDTAGIHIERAVVIAGHACGSPARATRFLFGIQRWFRGCEWVWDAPCFRGATYFLKCVAPDSSASADIAIEFLH